MSESGYRQRKYAYRLLTLPDGHPTKDILPVSLRSGDGSAQPWRIAGKWQNLVFQPKSKNLRPTTCSASVCRFLHRLDRGGRACNTPETEPANFPGKVIIQERKMAIKEAREHTSDLILWSDGSKGDAGGADAAVVCKSPWSYAWNICKISLRKNKEILDVELWGISEAQKISLKEP